MGGPRVRAFQARDSSSSHAYYLNLNGYNLTPTHITKVKLICSV